MHKQTKEKCFFLNCKYNRFQTNAISYIFGEVGQILHAEPTHTNIVKMSGDSAGDVVMDIDPESKLQSKQNNLICFYCRDMYIDF